jgi:hypothetical protein
MMMMRWIALTLVCILPCVVSEVQATEAGSGHDRADAVYLNVQDEYTLRADGGVIHHHAHKVRLLTNYAFHRVLGESFIVYNPEFQELKIHRSATTMADGTEVASTPNAFNEVLPGFCSNAPPYAHLREMVVTHLGLEKGAVIHFDYEIISKPGYLPFLMGEEVFSAPFPIEKKTVKVKVPGEVALKHSFLNQEGPEPVEKEEGEYKVYSWTLSDLPMVPPEAMGRDTADYTPYLAFSTCPTWNEAAVTMNQAFVASAWLDEECEAKIRELQTKAADIIDLAQAINRFVVDEIATAQVDPAYMGYHLIQSKDIFHHAVGTPLDKAALLTAMLRFAGIFAEPVLVSRHRAIAAEVPSWSQFDECRVICTLRQNLGQPLFFEKLLFLSPQRMVEGVYDDGLAGRTVFRPSLLNNHLLEVSGSSEKENAVKANLRLVMNDQRHLEGDLVLEVSGSLNPYLTVIRDAEGWAKGRLKKLLPGADVTGVKSVLIGEHKSLFKSKTKSTNPLEVKHGFIEYRIPSSPGGALDLAVPTALSKRATPLWLPRALSEEITITIDLPDGMDALYLPPTLELNTAAGTLRSAAWVEEGVLNIRRAISLRQAVSTDDYPALRILLREWKSDDSRRVLLKSGES